MTCIVLGVQSDSWIWACVMNLVRVRDWYVLGTKAGFHFVRSTACMQVHVQVELLVLAKLYSFFLLVGCLHAGKTINPELVMPALYCCIYLVLNYSLHPTK